MELALASYPGCTLTTPPGDATPVRRVHAPTYLPQDAVDARRRAARRRPRIADPARPHGRHGARAARRRRMPRRRTGRPGRAGGPTRRAPLGTVVGARSGDKGGDANLGVWARTDAGYAWLRGFLTVDGCAGCCPRPRRCAVDRYELPNLRALNFVIHGLLGEGVAASTRFDPQAKALGEWLRSRLVDVPEELP